MVGRSGFVTCVIAFCALALTASPVAAQQRCSPVVEAKLGQLGIEHGRLADAVYGRETTSGEGAELIAVRAWISLNDCDGAVIIQMRPDCRFVQASTTGSRKIAGLYRSC